MRISAIERKTGETNVCVRLNIDGELGGTGEIGTGCGFLDHMLTLWARHGRFDLDVKCTGDVEVDYHHTVEDVGIVIGRAFREALGDCKGIRRYGDIILPMDESLVMAASDVSGRAHLEYDAPATAEKVGDFDTELAEEFWRAFVREAGVTLHIRLLAGRNAHHIIESVFKAAARCLRESVSIDAGAAGEIPSTKGVL